MGGSLYWLDLNADRCGRTVSTTLALVVHVRLFLIIALLFLLDCC